MNPMRITMWQCDQHPADVAGNLVRLRDVAMKAAADKSQLLVTPEMMLTGYNIDAATVARLAEPADGPSSQAVQAIAREAGIAIVHGYVERDSAGRLFNAAQCTNGNGRQVGHYRKTHLYGDLDRSRFTPSDEPSAVFELNGWRVGLLICYDVEFPEAVRDLALRNAELVIVPTANMVGFDVVPLTLVPARAYENQFFVAYTNCSGDEAGLQYAGISTLASPDGRLLCQGGDGEEMLTADLDRARLRSPVLTYLADRRPALYTALTAAAASAP